MPTITRLVQGKKNPNRVNVYLDGQFAFALSIDEVGKHGLKRGLELTQKKIQSLVETDESTKVYAKILNFLSYRPRSVKEVRDRLYKYDVTEPDKQNEQINRLQKNGYLDDLAFARWFIESRNTHRPRSPRMLSQELASHGIGRDIIHEVIAEVTDPKLTIRAILDKKLGISRKFSLPERQKIYGHLGRLGFAWSDISEVVKSWESE